MNSFDIFIWGYVYNLTYRELDLVWLYTIKLFQLLSICLFAVFSLLCGATTKKLMGVSISLHIYTLYYI